MIPIDVIDVINPFLLSQVSTFYFWLSEWRYVQVVSGNGSTQTLRQVQGPNFSKFPEPGHQPSKDTCSVFLLDICLSNGLRASRWTEDLNSALACALAHHCCTQPQTKAEGKALHPATRIPTCSTLLHHKLMTPSQFALWQSVLGATQSLQDAVPTHNSSLPATIGLAKDVLPTFRISLA